MKRMDVDDDDEYMNAAAAHAAFVMTAKKSAWAALPILCTVEPRYVENSRVRSMIDFFADFSQNFSERALLLLKNSVTISITIFCTVEHPFNEVAFITSVNGADRYCTVFTAVCLFVC